MGAFKNYKNQSSKNKIYMAASSVLKKYLDDTTGDFYFETVTGIVDDAKIDVHSTNDPKEFVKQLKDNAFVNKKSLETEAELIKPKKSTSLSEIGTTLQNLKRSIF